MRSVRPNCKIVEALKENARKAKEQEEKGDENTVKGKE